MVSRLIKNKKVWTAGKNTNYQTAQDTIPLYICVNFPYTNLFAAIRANASLLFCPPESEATGRNASSPVTP